MYDTTNFDPWESLDKEQNQGQVETVPDASKAVDSTPEIKTQFHDTSDFDPWEADDAARITSAKTLQSGDAQKAAKVRGLSERYGGNRTATEINFDQLFAQATTDDFDDALAESPTLSQWFADNQKDAPIFKNDVGLLTRLETHFKSLYSGDKNVPLTEGAATAWDTSESTGDIALDEKNAPMMNSSQAGRGFQAGYKMAEQGLEWAKVSNDQRLLTEDFKKRDRAIDDEIKALTGEDADATFFNAGQILGTMIGAMKGGIEGAGAGGALAGSAMAVGAIPVAGEALLGAMAIGAGAYGTYQLEGGLELKTLIDNGVPYDKAVKIAAGVGFANSLIEMAGIKILGAAAAPAIRGLTSQFASKTAEALTVPTIQKALLDTAKVVGIGTGQEVVTEVLQEVSSITGEEIGRIWGETGAQGITPEQAYERLLDVAVMTAKGAGVLAALGAGPVMTGHMAKIARAEQTKSLFENLNQTVAQMEGLKLSPGATQEVIDGLAENVGADTVYIDATAFKQIMHEHGVTKQQLSEVASEVAQVLDQAAADGRDVTMSTGYFASNLSQTPLGQALLEHVRLSETDVSAAESKELEASVREMRKAAIDDQIDNVSGDETPETNETQAKPKKEKSSMEKALDYLKDRYTEQIEATGQFSKAEAQQQAAFGVQVVRNWAKRVGMSPDTMLRRAPTIYVGEASNQSLKQAIKMPDYLVSAVGKVKSIFSAAVSGVRGKKQRFENYLPVSERLVLDAQKLGFDLTGYQHIVDEDAIRHAVSRHGGENENQGAQVGLTEADFERLPLVVSEYDVMEKGGLTKSNRAETLVYTKMFPDGSQIVVEEVRKGRKKLAFHTAYKKKASPVQNSNKPSALRPKRAGSNSLDKDIIPSDIKLQQGSGSSARGAYSPRTNTIHLTANADLSTFAHEMGHWYLENLFEISTDPNASTLIKEDAKTILKDFGLSSVDQWRSLSFEEIEKLHERFASQVEIYLAEGKAPSASMEGFFRRLGAWIRDVYRTWIGGSKEAVSERYREQFGQDLPGISPEVRRVMDRMIAGEDSVSVMEQTEALGPLFETKPDNVSEADWLAYQATHDDATSQATQKLVEARAKDEKWYSGARSKALKVIQKQGKEVRDKIRERISRQINNRPEALAIDILKSGGKAMGMDNLKIDPQTLTDFSKRTIEKLRSMGLLRNNGMHVSTVRQLLSPMARFKSNKQMIERILAFGDREALIDKLTTQECLEKHSDLFDPKKIDDAVTQALHNEARDRMIATELKFLLGEGRSRIYIAAARQAAKDLIGRTSIRNASVKSFMAAESRAARKAQQALSKGDKATAAYYKRQQMVNHSAAMQVVEAEKRMRSLKKLKDLVFSADKKLAKTYDTNIMAVARVVLANSGYGGKIKADDMTPADHYLKKVKAYDPEIVEGLESFVERHPYSPNINPLDVSVDVFNRLIDDVRALVRLAKESKQVEVDGKKLDVESVVKELIEKINQGGYKTYAPGQTKAVTTKERFRKLYMTGRAYLMRVENWCIEMDGGQTGGLFWKYLYLPISKAAARYRNTQAEYQRKLLDLLRPMEEKWDSVGEIEAQEIGYTFERKAELIAALLHTGNESNKKKLLVGGRGPDSSWADITTNADGSQTISYERWERFIARAYREGIITKEDMDFVQAVWDLLEDTKKMSQKAFHEYYGFYFEEVQASPVMTPWGIYRGGYVPAATDSIRVAGRDRQLEQNLFENTNEYLAMMPVSRPGFTQSRVEFNKPLQLNIGMLGAHIQSVVKFSMMAPTVKNVQRLVNDRNLKERLNEIDPQVVSDLLTPWLRRSATQTVSTPTNSFGRILNNLRGLAGMSLMAANVANTIQQFTGFSIAIDLVGAKHMGLGLKAYLSDVSGTYEKVTEASPFMKARLNDFSYEFQNQVDNIASEQIPSTFEKTKKWTQQHAYFMQTAAQKIVDLPVWMAAYNKGIVDGLTDSDAVNFADSVVRRSQSSFDPENVARVETGDPLARSILVFYNYFNMQLNLLHSRYREARVSGRYGRLALDFALIVVIPAVLSEIIAQAFNGFDTGDDDDWDVVDGLNMITSSTFKNVVAMAPYVGNFINVGGTKLAKSNVEWISEPAKMLFGNNPYNDKLISVPVASLLENTWQSIPAVLSALDGEGSPKAAARNTLDALTLITGIPFSGLKRPVGYVAGVVGDEIYPENPLDVVRGVISGKDVNAE